MDKAITNKEEIQRFFAKIAKRYSLTNHLLSFGMDFYWRKVLVSELKDMVKKFGLGEKISILDVASGTGDVAISIRKEFENAKITLSDFCPEMLECAKDRGFSDIYIADALNLPFDDESFDFCTIAFGLRNTEDYVKCISELRRVSKYGFIILDFSMPKNVLLRKAYSIYLENILPKLANFITTEKDAYKYLSKSIHLFPKVNRILEIFKTLEMKKSKVKSLSFGTISVFTVEK